MTDDFAGFWTGVITCHESVCATHTHTHTHTHTTHTVRRPASPAKCKGTARRPTAVALLLLTLSLVVSAFEQSTGFLPSDGGGDDSVMKLPFSPLCACCRRPPPLQPGCQLVDLLGEARAPRSRRRAAAACTRTSRPLRFWCTAPLLHATPPRWRCRTWRIV